MNEQLELFGETIQAGVGYIKNQINTVKIKAKAALGYGTNNPIKYKEFKNIKGVDRTPLFGKYFKTGDIVELAGAQGGGKSFLTYKMITAICTGGQFLGEHAPQAKKVLLLDGELPVDDVNHRFDNILNVLDAEQLSQFEDNFSIINREFAGGLLPDLCKLQEHDQLFIDMLKFDVVVIDSLKTNTFGSNISSADEISGLIRLFLLLKAHGVTVIYINYFTKGEVVLGSVDFDIINDVTLKFSMDKKKGSGVRKLEVVKGRSMSDAEKAPIYFTFHPDDHGTPFRQIA